jgi:hypothetical protein
MKQKTACPATGSRLAECWQLLLTEDVLQGSFSGGANVWPHRGEVLHCVRIIYPRVLPSMSLDKNAADASAWQMELPLGGVPPRSLTAIAKCFAAYPHATHLPSQCWMTVQRRRLVRRNLGSKALIQ